MDTFFEHIVKKRFQVRDFLTILAIILGAGLLVMLGLLFGGYLGIFWLLLVCAVIYIAYLLISKQFVEFEYTLTNDDLDIDRITAKRRRRRILSVNCKAFDVLAAVNDPEHNRMMQDKSIKKVIMAASSPYSENAYFALFTKDSVPTLLIFEPTAQMLGTFKVFNPRKVFYS